MDVMFDIQCDILFTVYMFVHLPFDQTAYVPQLVT